MNELFPGKMTVEITGRDLNLLLMAAQEHIVDKIETEWWVRPVSGLVRRERLRDIIEGLRDDLAKEYERESFTR